VAQRIFISRDDATTATIFKLSTDYPPQADPPIPRSGIKNMADMKGFSFGHSEIWAQSISGIAAAKKLTTKKPRIHKDHKDLLFFNIGHSEI
jgi:hypothetical protein